MGRLLRFERKCDTLGIEDLSQDRVFEYFFFGRRRVLFLVDSLTRLEGIISLTDYTGHMDDIRHAVNKNYLFVKYDSHSHMFSEAEKLYDRYKIQSDLPVIDEERRLVGYITDQDILSDREDHYKKKIHETRQKIENLKKSYYLGKEITAFYKVTEHADIYIRKCQAFEDIFSCFDVTWRVTPLSDQDYLRQVRKRIQDKGSLTVQERTRLIFDFEMGNRTDLYRANGITEIYSVERFLEELTKLAEQEEFSRILRITRESEYRLKDYIFDNDMRDIKFAANRLLTKYVYDYMRQIQVPLSLESLDFDAALQMSCLVNGVRGSSQDTIGLAFCDLIEQQRKIEEGLENKEVFVFHVIGAVNAAMTESEKERAGNNGRLETLIEEKDLKSLRQLYQEDCEGEDILEYAKELSYGYPIRRRFENDLIVHVDHTSRFVNIENGIRRTAYQPEEYTNTVYVMGPCFALGLYVEDQHTIPSLLAKRMKEEEYRYRVVNLGILAANDSVELIRELPLEKGDIIINLYHTDKTVRNGAVIHTSRAFDSILDRGDMFFDKPIHCNRKGNQIYADIIYDKIKTVLRKDGRVPLKKNMVYDIFKTNSRDFPLYGIDSYLNMLDQERRKIPDGAKEIGSIVMNCNPFTSGHRHLVEYASGQSDYLFLFVVEEDQSFFKFEDRIEMVKRGCSDILNVVIIPSGKMIGSNQTFPEYFRRESMRDEEKSKDIENVNPSTDLGLFARYIVPALGITKRFAAEEPLDGLTRQYNRGMKKVMALFGVEFTEIPRKTLDSGEVISASSVRRAYKSRQFEKMGEMVPATTYEYLIDNQDKYLTGCR